MKIAFIAPRYHTNQHFWVKALTDVGIEVSFWVLASKGEEVHALLSPKQIRNGHEREDLHSLFRQEQPDAVVIRNPMTRLGRYAVAAARNFPANVVLYSQGPLNRKAGILQRAAIALLQRYAGSGRIAPWITPVQGQLGKRSKVLKNWYFVPFVMEPSPVRNARDDHSVRVVMIGKFMERKNHLLLVQAIHSLRDRYPVTLDIYGAFNPRNYRPTYTKLVSYLDTNNIEWVNVYGSVDYEELQTCLGSYDIFVLPSRNEAVGVSVLEAMGHGLPVVCSTTAGASDYVRHGENGYIFQSDSSEDLACALEKLCADPVARRIMGEKSLELVRTRHGPDRFRDVFLPLVDE